MIRPVLILWTLAAALAQSPELRVGGIEFYGYAGLDLAAVRKTLPLQEGDSVGRRRDVAAVYCDQKGRADDLYRPGG